MIRLPHFKIILLLGLFISTNCALAHNAIKLTHPTEGEIIFMLKEHPKVLAGGNVIQILTDKDKITYDVDGSVVFEFIDHADAGVNGIREDAVTFDFSGVALECHNLKANTPIYITDIAGRIMMHKQTDESGYLFIDTTNLTPGVYIFNSQEKTFKFYKK